MCYTVNILFLFKNKNCDFYWTIFFLENDNTVK